VGRFIPHGVPFYQKNAGADRYLLPPDEGSDIPLGRTRARALPAHFLHSVGNFQFYDPISRILFSGDLGASAPASSIGRSRTSTRTSHAWRGSVAATWRRIGRVTGGRGARADSTST